MARARRSWRVVLVDQRCHGLSSQVDPPFRPPHTLGASATDVAQLFRARFGRAPDMVIGHSLGGKVALEYLRQRACGLDLPRQVWCAVCRAPCECEEAVCVPVRRLCP